MGELGGEKGLFSPVNGKEAGWAGFKLSKDFAVNPSVLTWSGCQFHELLSLCFLITLNCFYWPRWHDTGRQVGKRWIPRPAVRGQLLILQKAGSTSVFKFLPNETFVFQVISILKGLFLFLTGGSRQLVGNTQMRTEGY